MKKQSLVKQVPKTKVDNRAVSIPRLLGVPTQMRAKLKYCQYFELNPGAGAVGVQTFRANSPYDPDFSGVGHQPLGWDQLAAFYNHYVVLGSEIVVKNCSAASADAVALKVMGVNLSDLTTAPGDVTNCCEQGTSHSRIYSGIANASDTALTVSHRYDPKSFFTIKDPEDNKEFLGSDTTGNPADGAFFVVFYAYCSSAIDPAAAPFWAEITYDVLLTERNNLASS